LVHLDRAQERDRLAEHRGRHVQAGALGVVGVAAARDQVALVAVDRFAERDRAAVITGIVAGLAAGELARRLLRLPGGEHGAAVGGLEIVAQPDFFDPVDAGAGGAHIPGARALVAPGADENVRRYLHVHWPLRDRQLAPGARAFELAGADFLRGHWCSVPVGVTNRGAVVP